jgi:uncharacterized membrane protein
MEEKNIRSIFVVSILLKGANALLEIAGGVLFLFTGTVTRVLQLLVQEELLEDPADFAANTVQHYLPYFSEHAQLFAALYLLSHGVIKIVLVIGLLRNKVWAYPSAIVVFSLFIAYQVYRFSFTHSVFLILLTIYDLAALWLIWHEYKNVNKRQNHPVPRARGG